MLVNNPKKIVIKLGSSTVIDDKGKFRKNWVSSLIKDLKKIKKNRDLVIVSSGAIALGQKYLKVKKKKIKLEMSQAIAAVGQIHLAGEFQKIFEKNKFKTGQILISLDDTEQRRRALNVRRTFENLFKLNAIPIVNENDTTATTEIKYGDNDRLAARVAQIIGADTLIIFSDVDGLIDNTKGKKIIKEIKNIDKNVYKLAEKKINPFGTGGIITKLEAAKICMNAGCHMYLANGNKMNPIEKMLKEKKYSCFIPKISNLDARKKWIISSVAPKGALIIDDGAKKALKSGKSLLAAGIKKVSGRFNKGDHIKVLDKKNNECARGLSSFISNNNSLTKIILS